MLDKNTEKLIEIYFKYSNKATLTVEEFIKFRKQAVNELTKGLKVNSNYASDPALQSVAPDIIRDAQNLGTNNNNIIISSKIENEHNDKSAELHSEDVTNDFSEESFLKMMKEMED